MSDQEEHGKTVVVRSSREKWGLTQKYVEKEWMVEKKGKIFFKKLHNEILKKKEVTNWKELKVIYDLMKASTVCTNIKIGRVILNAVN